MQVVLNNVSIEILEVLNSLKKVSPNLEIISEPCVYTKDEIKKRLDESMKEIESGTGVFYTIDEIISELGIK
ncbi:hypothetical protein [Campylobacter concisus]